MDIANIEKLIATSKVSEAIQASETMWRPNVEKTPLGADELRLLVITGTLLNQKGLQDRALGYLTRFVFEYKSQPSLAQTPNLYDWGELLYLGVMEAVTIKLREKYADRDNRDDLVEKELATLRSAQLSKAQAKVETKSAQAAPSAATDRKKRAAKTAHATGGGGCSTLMVMILTATTFLVVLAVFAIHVFR